ncbi:hypothetical protein I4F81_006783 [Pyropia yezoensis]|uniref:Uncharacterized protein n=1 Tax=Pyropia yezoensis TaxID=2788 RepID=A0ACC3C2A8_PYRYE|nr:hypothetical protein I4F81_006783 [Neopyropia yezoensis]
MVANSRRAGVKGRLRRLPVLFVLAAGVGGAVAGAAATAASAVAVDGIGPTRGGVRPFPVWLNGTAAAVGGAAAVGRLDLLPSLACVTGAALRRGGGARATGGGRRRGVWFRPPGASRRVWLQRGARVCEAPFEVATALEGLAAAAAGRGACVVPTNGAGQRLAFSELLPGRVQLSTERYDSLSDAGAAGTLLHERQVLRLLALQRTSASGGVVRRLGAFDVLAVTRETYGVCLDSLCNDVAAVASLEGVTFEPPNDTTADAFVPVLSYPRRSGEPGWVMDREVGLVSLGRAVLAHQGWLDGHPAWSDRMRLNVHLQVLPSGRPSDAVPPALREQLWFWSLQGYRQGYEDSSLPTTPWLQAIAFVLCEQPVRSFVSDAQRLCSGLLKLSAPEGPAPVNVSSPDDTAQLVTVLSQSYNRAVFGTEAPSEPTTNVELLLSVIVVFPELVALIVLLVSTRVWWARDLWVLLFVFLSGLVSMAGIIALLVRELRGDAWRAGAVRHRLLTAVAAPVPGPQPVVRTETLLLAARLGFRPALLRHVALGVSCTYVGVSVVIATSVWVLRRLRRALPPASGSINDSFDGALDDPAAGAPAAGARRPWLSLPPLPLAVFRQRPRRAAPPPLESVPPLPMPTAWAV